MADLYANLSYASTYFSERLHTRPWDRASPTDRQKALIMATRDIDRLDFALAKADPAQVLEFPRTGQAEVPDTIKQAACEIAMARLSGIDPDAEIAAAQMTHQALSGASTSFDRSSRPEHVLSGIASATAWLLLRPYLRERSGIKLSRV